MDAWLQDTVEAMEVIKNLIRDVEDFPKQGIVFKDITPLLGNPSGFEAAIEALVSPWLKASSGSDISKVAAIESRGFFFGIPVARYLGVGFVPLRKQGKLPSHSISQNYEREYGPDTIEMHSDAVRVGDRVLIVDDVLATAGTGLAAAKLIEAAGASVAGFSMLIELAFLSGREILADYRVESVLRFGED